MQKFTVVFSKTYSVDIEAETSEQAVKLWEDFDLSEIEFEEPNSILESVEWVDKDGGLNIEEFC